MNSAGRLWRGWTSALKRSACRPGTRKRTTANALSSSSSVIERMKFPGYFLIVADFIKWAKQQDIPVGPGRGSGAGSLVAYALTITDVDPLRFSLLFERFLNPERVSMPDFDIDFCQDRREEVIRYVQQKYGREQVAQIITFGSLQALCGATRRRPRAGDALRAGRQDLQTRPEQSGQSDAALEGDRGRTEASGGGREGARSSPVSSTLPRRSKGSIAMPRPTPPASSSATGPCRSSCRCTATRGPTCRSPSST